MHDKGGFAHIEVVLDFPGGLEVTGAKYRQLYTHLTRNFDLISMMRSIFSFESLFLSSCL